MAQTTGNAIPKMLELAIGSIVRFQVLDQLVSNL